MAQRTLIEGKHRTAALAERHRRELERGHPGAVVSILARRNALGVVGNRGHFFTFELVPLVKEKEIDTLEDFFEEYDEAEEYETEDWEDTPSYGQAE